MLVLPSMRIGLHAGSCLGVRCKLFFHAFPGSIRLTGTTADSLDTLTVHDVWDEALTWEWYQADDATRIKTIHSNPKPTFARHCSITQ